MFYEHSIDPNSDEYYDIAREYAIFPDMFYVSRACNIDIRTVRALSKDKDFLELVEEMKKPFGDKTPFEIKVEATRMLVLHETTTNALMTGSKGQAKAIDQFFAISKDIPKGSTSKKDDKPKGTSVTLQIGEEEYEEEEEKNVNEDTEPKKFK